jgi:predicted DCC family thiol-disulfide oxidoreductase YuxK
MNSLTVLYDARCNLCVHVRSWLETQPSYLDLVFLAAGSSEARQRLPQLDHAATLDELTVVSDEGAVYTGANAWVICLWALKGYRAWALRLSSPELLPVARRVVLWVAQNRFRFGSRSFEQALSHQHALTDDCAGGTCAR